MLLIWSSLRLITYLTFIMTKGDIIIIPILWVEKLRYRDIKWLVTMTPKQNYQFSLKINTNKIQISYRVCFTDVLLKENHCWQHKYTVLTSLVLAPVLLNWAFLVLCEDSSLSTLFSFRNTVKPGGDDPNMPSECLCRNTVKPPTNLSSRELEGMQP